MTDPRFDDKPLGMLRRVGKQTLANKMIDMFLASAPHRLAAIEIGLEGGDLEVVSRGAHSLKPSAGQLGAVRLQELCQQVEDAARNGDGAAAGSLLPDLRSEVSLAIEWLQTEKE